jgi:hypothetical protein
MWKEAVVAKFKTYLEICCRDWEGHERSQGSRCPVPRFETEPFPIHVTSVSAREDFNVDVLSKSVIEYATSVRALWRSFGLKNAFICYDKVRK